MNIFDTGYACSKAIPTVMVGPGRRCFAVDLHEDLVKVPAPVAALHPLDAALADLGGEHRAEAMPPKSHCLVADLDAALVQQVLDVPQREREADVQHNRQADDLGGRLEPLEEAGLGHVGMLTSPLPRLKPSSFDKINLPSNRHRQE
jgi:hypothetical protein